MKEIIQIKTKTDVARCYHCTDYSRKNSKNLHVYHKEMVGYSLGGPAYSGFLLGDEKEMTEGSAQRNSKIRGRKWSEIYGIVM